MRKRQRKKIFKKHSRRMNLLFEWFMANTRNWGMQDELDAMYAERARQQGVDNEKAPEEEDL